MGEGGPRGVVEEAPTVLHFRTPRNQGAELEEGLEEVGGRPSSKSSDGVTAFVLLGRATFGGALYALMFLWTDVSRLLLPQQDPSPGIRFVDMPPVLLAANLLLLALPVVVGVLLIMGYRVLIGKAMVGLSPSARDEIWKARRWFHAFWGILALIVIVFFLFIAIQTIPAFEPATFGITIVRTALPAALVIALVLFLGHTAWSVLPASRRRWVRRVVWIDVMVIAATAMVWVYLLWLAWMEFWQGKPSQTLFSPLANLPADVFNFGTFILLYMAFRWARTLLVSSTQSSVASLSDLASQFPLER